MKTLKNILFLFILSISMVSCLVDDEVRNSENDKGPDIVGFTKTSYLKGALADGNAVSLNVPVVLTGPNSESLKKDVKVKVSVDPSSTAKENVHYKLNETEITISPETLRSIIPVTIITAGIKPPLDKAPILKLNLTLVEDNDKIVLSGRTGSAKVQLNYLCFSNLKGTYTCPQLPDVAGGQATVTELDKGKYRVSALPYLSAGAALTFDFIDNCGVITIVDWGYSSGKIEGSGTVDSDKNEFTITYKIYKNDGSVWFDFSNEPATYTKK